MQAKKCERRKCMISTVFQLLSLLCPSGKKWKCRHHVRITMVASRCDPVIIRWHCGVVRSLPDVVMGSYRVMQDVTLGVMKVGVMQDEGYFRWTGWEI
jgi:hypothetical protein